MKDNVMVLNTESNCENVVQNPWFICQKVNSAPTINEIGLPQALTINYSNEIKEIPVEWELIEAPWECNELLYYPHVEGVYTFSCYIEKCKFEQKIFVSNEAVPVKRKRKMEKLNRGLVVVPLIEGEGNLVKWRTLATEYDHYLLFDIYRNDEKINIKPVDGGNYVDKLGKANDEYYVIELSSGEKSEISVALKNNYMDIKLQQPKPRKNPAIKYGAPENTPDITYTANDMSVADVNGDGKYELLVKWIPSEQRDPGLSPQHTGETIFDLYTLEGEILWRINLGINITSSAHHSSFNFYDINEDGIAEFIIKTADGTRVYKPKDNGEICDLFDLAFFTIGDANAVWVGELLNPLNNEINKSTLGRISTGPEFLTVFNGLTGMPIDTINYFAPYGIMEDWGDFGDYGNNRSDRFLAAVAYLPKLDDTNRPYPSVIEVRGHYGPLFVGAYQLIDEKLILKWTFKLRDWVKEGFYGNHSISIADVNSDGFDELIFGSVVLKHDGCPLWIADGSRGTLKGTHGDALHVTKMNPNSDEFYIMTPLERQAPNVKVYNARTGATLWEYSLNLPDVGRGIAANITPTPGFEIWAGEPPIPGAKKGTPIYNLVTGELLDIEQPGRNFRIYWNGDLLSELLDGVVEKPLNITKYNYFTGKTELVQDFIGTQSNNHTKANPCLQADIFGDWREEVIVRTNEEDTIRIYTTNIPTDYCIFTLMHEPTYRLQTNCQNATYNQPPHLGFYLGEDIKLKVLERKIPKPDVII